VLSRDERLADPLVGEQPDPVRRTWERLRGLKRRYDPDNLFHLNHNIPPADS
jgi:FAD/FMN-containing dehydrogenase